MLIYLTLCSKEFKNHLIFSPPRPMIAGKQPQSRSGNEAKRAYHRRKKGRRWGKKEKNLMDACTHDRDRASSARERRGGRFVILVTGARDLWWRNKNTRGGSAREKGSPLAFARKRSGRSFMNSPDIPLYQLSYYYYYYYYCYYYPRPRYDHVTTPPPLLRHSDERPTCARVWVQLVCARAPTTAKPYVPSCTPPPTRYYCTTTARRSSRSYSSRSFQCVPPLPRPLVILPTLDNENRSSCFDASMN